MKNIKNLKNNNFNIIVKNNNECCFIIFENNYKKNNDIKIKTNIFRKTLIIEYNSNDRIEFNNVNINTIELLKKMNKIYLVEIEENGNAKEPIIISCNKL